MHGMYRMNSPQQTASLACKELLKRGEMGIYRHLIAVRSSKNEMADETRTDSQTDN